MKINLKISGNISIEQLIEYLKALQEKCDAADIK